MGQGASIMRSTRKVPAASKAQALGMANKIVPVEQNTAQKAEHIIASSPGQQEAFAFGFEDIGEAKTLEYRRFLTQGSARVSSWHDVPLKATSGNLHAVIEIPRLTTAKMEMATKETRAPIKQGAPAGLDPPTFGSSPPSAWLACLLTRRSADRNREVRRHEKGQAA